jgi:hypothetical protein
MIAPTSSRKPNGSEAESELCRPTPDWASRAIIEEALEALARFERTEQARRIWLEQTRRATGTIVEEYLRRRGIGHVPRIIRYAPRLRHPGGGYFDAMVAAVQNSEGRLVAIHRTYLDGPAKARVRPNKLSFGPIRGNAVRIGPAIEGEPLVICEGIEDALSCQQEAGLSAWAALGVYNLGGIILPPEITAVIIASDADKAGRDAALEAARAYPRQGREVRIAYPPTGKDFNAALINEQAATAS